MLRRPAFMLLALSFFGADHMVFATDSPYDSRFGERVCSETVPAVEAMAIPDADKEKIFHGNAQRLFRLPG